MASYDKNKNTIENNVLIHKTPGLAEIGANIAFYRKQAGLTQAQVAKNLEIEPSTVSRIENGLISPTITKLYQFSELFNCPMSDLLSFPEDRQRSDILRVIHFLRSASDERREALVNALEILSNMP